MFVRKMTVILSVLMLVVPMVSACGNSNLPFQLDLNKFAAKVASYQIKHPPSSEWVVYFAPGTVITKHLWRQQQNLVMDAQIQYNGNSPATDVVIQCGSKTVTSPQMAHQSSLGFYIKSASPNKASFPQTVDISWKINGVSKHRDINMKSMVELSEVNSTG
ncbi:hypothetical protein [Alicyclobacillus sp. SO9]|uniref:hypothetical protein n=1 Tax=Alicyclobacillus sp. SO9 TaxID=2665646 RepID=UPI0018E89A0B|nr:hypothetical protein [Alicyclobacillus sp. SO9]QQE78907.1 hypothetical protein GI364_24260 [Alicyclobacillus sp. SO9]